MDKGLADCCTNAVVFEQENQENPLENSEDLDYWLSDDNSTTIVQYFASPVVEKLL